MYVCMYVCMYVYTCICIYIYMYIYIYIYVYICIHMHTYTYAYAYMHMYIHIHIHMCIHTYTYTYTYTCIKSIYIYTHICTCKDITDTYKIYRETHRTALQFVAVGPALHRQRRCASRSNSCWQNPGRSWKLWNGYRQAHAPHYATLYLPYRPTGLWAESRIYIYVY